jgi:hypothetical protein
LFWYVEIENKFCPHLSVTFCNRAHARTPTTDKDIWLCSPSFSAKGWFHVREDCREKHVHLSAPGDPTIKMITCHANIRKEYVCKQQEMKGAYELWCGVRGLKPQGDFLPPSGIPNWTETLLILQLSFIFISRLSMYNACG